MLRAVGGYKETHAQQAHAYDGCTLDHAGNITIDTHFDIIQFESIQGAPVAQLVQHCCTGATDVTNNGLIVSEPIILLEGGLNTIFHRYSLLLMYLTPITLPHLN